MEAKVRGIFRFRSLQRDTETDRIRIEPVLQAIANALEAAVRERDSLRLRVADARDLASVLAGTADDEYLTRDSARASIIGQYEEQMRTGEERLRVLAQQISTLMALSDLSRRNFPDVGK
jgi:hypothetical protein